MNGVSESVPCLSEEHVRAAERKLVHPGGKGPLAALCLSGGGIRSATFALGVLQALARFGLLGQFHYLSTVSGGGYTGGWLTAWRTHRGNDEHVFAALDRFREPTGGEAPEIGGLRAGSNYLTPKLGLLSPDTWAAVALVLRNLALNWVVFVPLFMAALFLPKFGTNIVRLVGPGSGSNSLPWLFIAVAAALAALALAVRGRLAAPDGSMNDRRFQMFVGLPLVLSALGATLGTRAGPGWHLFLYAVVGTACYALAWCIGYFLWRRTEGGIERTGRTSVAWRMDLSAFAVAGFAAGLLIGTGLSVQADLGGATILFTFGPAWILLSFALADAVFVGVNSFARRGDLDREWLGRYDGWLLAAAATWIVICAVDLYMPAALDWTWGKATAYLGTLGISGAITLALGPSPFTSATSRAKVGERPSLSALVPAAAVVFALCLAGALSALDDRLVCALVVQGATISKGSSCELANPAHAAGFQAIAALVLGALSFGLSWFVNVNRFSLHALYRNRLVRNFLGSARRGSVPGRAPDPFSGFDPADNMAMSGTVPTPGPDGARLFHVVNMALNVTATDNLAWQERKAESFTVTALHAGNRRVGYRPTAAYGDPNGGITLGTAMAISGAAVSPNSGYHSSPLVGVLLTLFNLRLGWWLGNPRQDKFNREGPTPGLWPILQELAGLTRDDSTWAYLSDGGHFENLGLYEMVRRGCRAIVVSDAGCDPDSAFEDLGNAVRKIYIDFGVSIDFETLDIPARAEPARPGLYCAVGTLRYPDGETGWLLYIKPGYRGIEPAHVRSYALANPTFPHESTANQWFTESQFEAYRALGAFITERICTGGEGIPPGGAVTPMNLDALILNAREYMKKHRRSDGAAVDRDV